ncbi:hypothetical protein D9757_000494 [Collybiopsis confluens]|uniref:Uncharacterized protein n=1 Tax=Collybiopsis confluens TaxID=2823264 RepID=A0A8H5I1T0_9AGAR|nr:hypothetical protein D9757_000494 [Collybiopsis confluens]
MGTSQIPLDRAYLTAIWLETLFYGINMILFFSYLFIVRYKRRHSLSKIIVVVAVFMFIFSSIHVSLGFSRLIEGFIVLRNQNGGPATYFSDVSIPLNVAKVIIHTVNSILGDSILVWRCYNVWGQNWLPSLLPILLIIGSAIAGFGQGVEFARAKTIHSAFESELEKWNGSVFSLSLATNVLVTTLIAARIWWVGRQIGGFRGSHFLYRRVLTMVIESGAIYSSAIIIEITLYFLGNNAFYIIYDPIAQLTAIVPTMIIVMTSLGLTSDDLYSAEGRTRNAPSTGRTGRTGGTMAGIESRPQFAGARARPANTLDSIAYSSSFPDTEQGTAGIFVELDHKDSAKAL